MPPFFWQNDLLLRQQHRPGVDINSFQPVITFETLIAIRFIYVLLFMCEKTHLQHNQSLFIMCLAI